MEREASRRGLGSSLYVVYSAQREPGPEAQLRSKRDSRRFLVLGCWSLVLIKPYLSPGLGLRVHEHSHGYGGVSLSRTCCRNPDEHTRTAWIIVYSVPPGLQLGIGGWKGAAGGIGWFSVFQGPDENTAEMDNVDVSLSARLTRIPSNEYKFIQFRSQELIIQLDQMRRLWGYNGHSRSSATFCHTPKTGSSCHGSGRLTPVNKYGQAHCAPLHSHLEDLRPPGHVPRICDFWFRIKVWESYYSHSPAAARSASSWPGRICVFTSYTHGFPTRRAKKIYTHFSFCMCRLSLSVFLPLPLSLLFDTMDMSNVLYV